jgi:hypothetical protein
MAGISGAVLLLPFQMSVMGFVGPAVSSTNLVFKRRRHTQRCLPLVLTTDKNIRYQQNLAGRKIAIVVLGRQQWPAARSHIDRMTAAPTA